MVNLLKQIKKRRTTLNLKQRDMTLRIGVSRQQYQRLESRGNPRLATLELIAKGLNSELMLIPQEKRNAVLAVLNDEGGTMSDVSSSYTATHQGLTEHNSLSDDPWQGLLSDTD